MKWSEVRDRYPNQWILFEALEAESKDGHRIIKDIAVINCYDNGQKALKEYADKHKKDKSREMYVYHTKHRELEVKERTGMPVF